MSQNRKLQSHLEWTKTIRGYRSGSVCQMRRVQIGGMEKRRKGRIDRRGSSARAETQNLASAIGKLKLRRAIYMTTETTKSKWRWRREDGGGRHTERAGGKRKGKNRMINTRKITGREDRISYKKYNPTIRLSNAIKMRASRNVDRWLWITRARIIEEFRDVNKTLGKETNDNFVESWTLASRGLTYTSSKIKINHSKFIDTHIFRERHARISPALRLNIFPIITF